MQDPSRSEELVAGACPSIAYRSLVEIAGRPRTDPVAAELRRRILAEPAVRALAGRQAADGWIGGPFHGFGGHEAAIRQLVEFGVEPSAPLLARAVDALDAEPARLRTGLGVAGEILDDTGHGGTRTIRAATLALAGGEDRPGVRAEVESTVQCIAEVANVASPDDLVERRRGRLVYRPGRRLPSIYHLRLLAAARGWRSLQSSAAVAAGVCRLAELSPLPQPLVLHRGRLVAPASFCIDDFAAVLAGLDAAGWMRWFHRTELLARMGVANASPAARRQLDELAGLLLGCGGRFGLPLAHPYFMRWGSYTGLALERDWRSAARREHDLTFRGRLILRLAAV